MSAEGLVYAVAGLFCALVVWLYLRHETRKSRRTGELLREARERGLHEPASLHPRIDPSRCIGSGACVRACPEKNVLGLVDNRAVLVNASACIGHGACEAACPVEAIDLVFGTARRGVELPRVRENFETNVPGLFIAGELGGMGLIRNAVTQGRQAVEHLAAGLRGQASGDGDDAATTRLDLLVVGAGPAGIAAALAAQQAGLRCKVLEQDSPGGTIRHYPRRKLVMTQPMCLPGESPWTNRECSKEELLERFDEVLGRRRPELALGERVDEVAAEPGGFQVRTSRADGTTSRHHARRVLLCIGRRGTPRRLGIPGEEAAHVHYQLQDPDAFAGEACVVVGGGDSAIEGALRLAAAGARPVHLVHRGDGFPRSRPANQQALEEARRTGAVEVRLGCAPTAVEREELVVESPAGTERLPARLVLVQVGGELPSGLLARAGVVIDTHFGRQVRRGDET